MDRHPLEAYEQGLSIISVSFADDANVYFAVGAAITLPDEVEPSKVLCAWLLSFEPDYSGYITAHIIS